MKLDLVRYGLGRDSTLGKLFLDGEFGCFTLEDERRKHKAPGETCIPEGEYPVEFRTVGGFHQRYRNALPDIHRGMLWVRDVPGFEYILVHMGNTDEDTAGCILLGSRAMVDLEGEFAVKESKVAYRHVYPRIAGALIAHERASARVGAGRPVRRPLFVALLLGAIAWYCFDRWRPRRDPPHQPHPYPRGHRWPD